MTPGETGEDKVPDTIHYSGMNSRVLMLIVRRQNWNQCRQAMFWALKSTEKAHSKDTLPLSSKGHNTRRTRISFEIVKHGQNGYANIFIKATRKVLRGRTEYTSTATETMDEH